MICFDDDGQEYWQPPEIPRRFFDWVDHPLTDEDALEGSEYYNQALLTDQACWILQHSPTIQASFEIYQSMIDKVTITAEPMRSYGDYDIDKEHIRVSTRYGLWERVSTLAHEYRHVIQGFEGLLSNHANKTSRRSTYLLQEADAVAFEVMVGYELKDRFPKVWHTMQFASPKYMAVIPDFLECVENDPNSVENGLAAQRVLEEYLSTPFIRAWDWEYYLDKSTGFRRNISDSRALSSLRQYFNAYMGMPFSSAKNGSYCQVEREAYLNQENTETTLKALRGLKHR